MPEAPRIWHNPWIRWLLRVLLAILILGLLITRVDYADLLGTLRTVDSSLLILAFILYSIFRYVLAYQMSLGLAPLRLSFTTLQLLRISLISDFYRLILPGNLIAGSIASWYKLARPSGRIIEAGALVVYFRLINLLILVGIGLVGTWYDQELASTAFRTVTGTMFLSTILLLIPVVSSSIAYQIAQIGNSLFRHWPLPDWLNDRGQKIWEVFLAFHNLDRLTIIKILGLSFLSNILAVVIWFVLALAIDIDLSIFVIGWVSSFLGITQMVPITIAGLGVREASLVLLLGKYGISEAQSLTFSLAIFCLLVFGSMLGGLLEGWDLIRGVYQAGHSMPEVQEHRA